jgi:membrane protein
VLLIVVAIAGLVFGQDAARGAISEELGQLLGPAGGEFIKSILERSSDPGSGTIATVLGVVTVLITASGVFGEMHTGLNNTFKAKPSDEPISALIRTRAEAWAWSPRSASCWWCRWLPALLYPPWATCLQGCSPARS